MKHVEDDELAYYIVHKIIGDIVKPYDTEPKILRNTRKIIRLINMLINDLIIISKHNITSNNSFDLRHANIIIDYLETLKESLNSNKRIKI